MQHQEKSSDAVLKGHPLIEMYLIPLRNGGFARVDSDSYLYLSKFKWSRTLNGYARRSNDGQLMHRLIMGLKPGDSWHIDHINRVKLDNRVSNLQLVNGQLENLLNHPGKGYSKKKSRWCVELTRNYKRVWGGSFATEQEAIERVAQLRNSFRRSSEQAPHD